MSRTRMSQGAWVLVACLLAASGAWAQESGEPPQEPDPTEYADSGFGMDLSVYGILNFGYYDVGGGMGAQFAYPILPNGFIPSPRFRDAFQIEGGLDFVYWNWGYGTCDWHLIYFVPQAGVRWTVYVLDNLAPFVSVKLGMGAGTWIDDCSDTRDDTDYDFFWSTTVGIIWDFTAWAALRAEFGYGWYDDIVRVGVQFRF